MGVDYDQDSMTRRGRVQWYPEFKDSERCSSSWHLIFSLFRYEAHQNLDEACEMARVAFENAIAELHNVAEGSCKDSTMIRQCRPSDLGLVQIMNQF